MIEFFKDIPGYEGCYQVSNMGNIKSLPRATTKGGLLYKELVKGYHRCRLSKLGICKTFQNHRLVLLAFIGYSTLDVNHKNGIKIDNRLENLEYCTKSENELHSYRVLGKKGFFQLSHPYKGIKGEKHFNSKSVLQYSKQGEFIKEWGCIMDIERELGIGNSRISSCCNGRKRCKTAGGFIWKHK